MITPRFLQRAEAIIEAAPIQDGRKQRNNWLRISPESVQNIMTLDGDFSQVIVVMDGFATIQFLEAEGPPRH